jgi:hypothetical protein
LLAYLLSYSHKAGIFKDLLEIPDMIYYYNMFCVQS